MATSQKSSKHNTRVVFKIAAAIGTCWQQHKIIVILKINPNVIQGFVRENTVGRAEHVYF